MNYLDRDTRDEIASVLAAEHDSWVKYRDQQPKHPPKAVNVKRGVAEAKIRRLRELIALLSPKMLKS